MQLGVSKFGDFEVEVVDSCDDYLATLKVGEGAGHAVWQVQNRV